MFGLPWKRMRRNGIMSNGGHAASVTTLISDTFTDTDGATVNGRTPSPTNTPATTWAVLAGTITVQSNRAQSATDSLGTLDAGIADGSVSAVIRLSAVSTNNAGGVIGRAADNSNYWMARLYNGAFDLYEVNGGGFTLRDTTAFAASSNTDYTVKIVFNGTSITGTVDGGNTLSYTSTFQQSTTKHGIALYGAGGQTSNADAFTLTDATS